MKIKAVVFIHAVAFGSDTLSSATESKYELDYDSETQFVSIRAKSGKEKGRELVEVPLYNVKYIKREDEQTDIGGGSKASPSRAK